MVSPLDDATLAALEATARDLAGSPLSNSVLAMVAEIRERRAADLTDDERADLSAMIDQYEAETGRKVAEVVRRRVEHSRRVLDGKAGGQ